MPHDPAGAGADPIRSVDVLVSSPGRNFVTVRVRTREGLVGLGDATLNGRELAVASYLRDHVAPMLEGRDSQQVEDTWQLLYRAPYWRRGPVAMSAVAAVDTALWDIKARRAGMPLYQLLGGACRTGALAYGHATGRDLPELLDSVHAWLDRGFTAVRVQTAVPGLPAAYGVGDGAGHYEPARRGGPPLESGWDSAAYLRFLPQMLEAVREEVGPEPHLLHDVHHRLRPVELARLARDVEPYRLFWLEDGTPVEDQTALRLARQHSVTPLAVGEVLNSVEDYRTLLQEQLVDYVRSSVTHAGGVTGLRRLLDLAAVHHARSGIHGATDISPVGYAAGLHLDLAVHNFGIQEYMPQQELVGSVFETSFRLENGSLHPGDEPGLGVTYRDSEAARFPYRAAALPYARLTDGTVHDW